MATPVSPVLAETKISMSWPSRLSAGSLTVLFVAAAAYRLNFLNAQEFDEPPLAWRRCPSPYWNESRLIVVFLLLPVAKSWFEMIRCFWQDPQSIYLNLWMMSDLMVLWMCMIGLFRHKSALGEKAMQQTVRVPFAALAGTALAIAILTVSAAEALAWCAFSSWVLPW